MGDRRSTHLTTAFRSMTLDVARMYNANKQQETAINQEIRCLVLYPIAAELNKKNTHTKKHPALTITTRLRMLSKT